MKIEIQFLYKNYISNKTEVENKLAAQIALRYQEPAICPENLDLTTVSYFLPLTTILNNDFSKTVRVSTLVVKACSHFLSALG